MFANTDRAARESYAPRHIAANAYVDTLDVTHSKVVNIATTRVYVDARERGESVPLAFYRARDERVAATVLDPIDPWNVSDPLHGSPLDAYAVDVVAWNAAAALPGWYYNATTGERYPLSVQLPFGATAHVHVYDDAETSPDDVGDLDPELFDAWKRDAWGYVGVSVVVTLADGRQGEAAVWGVERGDYFPGSDEAQVIDRVYELMGEAVHEAERVTRDRVDVVTTFSGDVVRFAGVDVDTFTTADLSLLVAGLDVLDPDDDPDDDRPTRDILADLLAKMRRAESRAHDGATVQLIIR